MFHFKAIGCFYLIKSKSNTKIINKFYIVIFEDTPKIVINQFNLSTFASICDKLAQADDDLAAILTTHGYPPMWSRPNSFETLVHIILEQQVSLASALSALNKLRERVQEITPARVLLLTD